MTKLTDEELLTGIDKMIEQAPGVGLCTFGFKIVRNAVSDLVTERNQLRAYREPQKVNPYKYYAGQCPRCDVVFLDNSTHFCGNCGQALAWE